MRSRIAASVSLTVLAMVALTGCLKLDADIEVHTDETVSGTMTLGVSKELISMFEEMAEGMGGESTGGFDEDMFNPDEVPEGAEVEPFEDDKFIGQTITFSDITLEELTSSTTDESEDSWTLVHEGDEFIFEGDASFSSEETTTETEGMDLGLDEIFAQSDMRIALTFPGEVTEANGEIDGNTVVWRPKFGETLQMRAVAKDKAGFPWMPVLSGAAVVLLLGVLGGLAWAMRRRPKAEPTLEAEGDGGYETVPPVAPELAPDPSDAEPTVVLEQPNQPNQP